MVLKSLRLNLLLSRKMGAKEVDNARIIAVTNFVLITVVLISINFTFWSKGPSFLYKKCINSTGD